MQELHAMQQHNNLQSGGATAFTKQIKSSATAHPVLIQEPYGAVELAVEVLHEGPATFAHFDDISAAACAAGQTGRACGHALLHLVLG